MFSCFVCFNFVLYWLVGFVGFVICGCFGLWFWYVLFSCGVVVLVWFWWVVWLLFLLSFVWWLRLFDGLFVWVFGHGWWWVLFDIFVF